MKDQGGGKIINISSLMSVLGRATIQPYTFRPTFAYKQANKTTTQALIAVPSASCTEGTNPHNLPLIVVSKGGFHSRSLTTRCRYNATKFAINGLTRGLACELGPYNIQVNAIGPGYFVTDLTKVLVSHVVIE